MLNATTNLSLSVSPINSNSSTSKASTKFGELPEQVLENIFEILEREDRPALVKCCQLNQLCFHVASRLLHKRIVISGDPNSDSRLDYSSKRWRKNRAVNPNTIKRIRLSEAKDVTIYNHGRQLCYIKNLNYPNIETLRVILLNTPFGYGIHNTNTSPNQVTTTYCAFSNQLRPKKLVIILAGRKSETKHRRKGSLCIELPLLQNLKEITIGAISLIDVDDICQQLLMDHSCLPELSKITIIYSGNQYFKQFLDLIVYSTRLPKVQILYVIPDDHLFRTIQSDYQDKPNWELLLEEAAIWAIGSSKAFINAPIFKAEEFWTQVDSLRSRISFCHPKEYLRTSDPHDLLGPHANIQRWFEVEMKCKENQ